MNEKKPKKIFILNFFFLCMGIAQLFEKTPFGKLVPLGGNGAWVYALAKNAKDLAEMLGRTEETKEKTTFQAEGSIAIEAESIEECLEIFLLYIRSGYHFYEYKKKESKCRTLVTKEEIKPILKIGFRNWPIEIKEVFEVPGCSQMNVTPREEDTLTCAQADACNIANACPIDLIHSVKIDEFLHMQGTRTTREEKYINGLNFPLEIIHKKALV